MQSRWWSGGDYGGRGVGDGGGAWVAMRESPGRHPRRCHTSRRHPRAAALAAAVTTALLAPVALADYLIATHATPPLALAAACAAITHAIDMLSPAPPHCCHPRYRPPPRRPRRRLARHTHAATTPTPLLPPTLPSPIPLLSPLRIAHTRRCHPIALLPPTPLPSLPLPTPINRHPRRRRPRPPSLRAEGGCRGCRV